jgi:hypothetical protein
MIADFSRLAVGRNPVERKREVKYRFVIDIASLK